MRAVKKFDRLGDTVCHIWFILNFSVYIELKRKESFMYPKMRADLTLASLFLHLC